MLMAITANTEERFNVINRERFLERVPPYADPRKGPYLLLQKELSDSEVYGFIYEAGILSVEKL